MDQNRQVDTITIGDVKNIGRRYTPSVWHYSIHDKTAGVLKDITEGGINIYLQSHGFIYTSYSYGIFAMYLAVMYGDPKYVCSHESQIALDIYNLLTGIKICPHPPQRSIQYARGLFVDQSLGTVSKQWLNAMRH